MVGACVSVVTEIEFDTGDTQLLLFVITTLYVPVILAVAGVNVGLLIEDVNPFGPIHA